MTRYGLALIAVLATIDVRLNAVELIENGSFEIGREPPSRMRIGWDDARGLGNDIGLRVREWPYFVDGELQNGNAAFEFPPGEIPDDFVGTIQPAEAGLYHGSQWGLINGTGMFGSATQIVDAARYGGAPYEFSAWLVSSDIVADVGIKISKPSATSLLNTGKIWFPSIYITECGTGILADGDLSADSCAFGYTWLHGLNTGIHLNGTGATMFTFRYVHPLSSDTAFKVTGGAGRLYVQAVNAVMDTQAGVQKVLLDISGGSDETGFFHINGVTGDNGTLDYMLLKNHDDGNGLTHVRFTNCHFTTDKEWPKNNFRIWGVKALQLKD